MTFDFFYGAQSEQFAFYRIPKALIMDRKFRSLSTDAKILYGILLDRMDLSAKNKWFDAANRVYIIFTTDEVMETMNCATEKAVKLMNELESFGLIVKYRQGQGKPNLIYVKNFILPEDSSSDNGHDLPNDDPDFGPGPDPNERKSDVKGEDFTEKENNLTVKDSAFTNRGENSVKENDITDKKDCNLNESSEFRKSKFRNFENRNSKISKIEIQEFRKSKSSDTDNIDTEYRETDTNDTDTSPVKQSKDRLSSPDDKKSKPAGYDTASVSKDNTDTKSTPNKDTADLKIEKRPAEQSGPAGGERSAGGEHAEKEEDRPSAADMTGHEGKDGQSGKKPADAERIGTARTSGQRSTEKGSATSVSDFKKRGDGPAAAQDRSSQYDAAGKRNKEDATKEQAPKVSKEELMKMYPEYGSIVDMTVRAVNFGLNAKEPVRIGQTKIPAVSLRTRFSRLTTESVAKELEYIISVKDSIHYPKSFIIYRLYSCDAAQNDTEASETTNPPREKEKNRQAENQDPDRSDKRSPEELFDEQIKLLRNEGGN